MREVALKLTPARAVSATIPDERLIYAQSSGVSAIFIDDVWDLSATEIGSRSGSTLVIDFNYISHNKPAWRLAAKELAYHRLNTKISSVISTVQPYTCAREQMRLKRFIRWLDTYYPDVTSPSLVTQGIVHAYRLWLTTQDQADALDSVSGGNIRKGKEIDPFSVWTYMSPLKSFDNYREYLTDPLPFSPYGGKLTASFLGVDLSSGVNKTPPIPDDVLHPLITVSMRYVDHYWADISAMADERRAAWTVSKEEGWSKFDGWRTNISVCPELQKPWREPLGYAGHHVNHEFRHEMGNLIAACATVILYLSGMRPREFCSLENDCLRGVVDPVTGSVVRWRIRGIPAKKKPKKLKPVEWVVPEAAAKAIKVLQAVLQPFRDRRGSTLLTLNLDAFQANLVDSSQQARAYKSGLDERSLSTRLNTLLSVIKSRYGYSFDGRLMPSQFRRTLARHIARQPYGVIAGKLQYHHVKTAVFEGYAGSADDGFRLEVADEELLANVDLLDELRQDARDGYLAGPGAATLVREYDAAKAAEVGNVMVDSSSKEIALGAATKSLAKRLHVGALNFCVYGTAKALCLTDSEAEDKDAGPNINMCSPDACGNSVVGACHIPRWENLLAEVNSLASSAKSGPQKASLKFQGQRYERLLKSKVSHG